MIGFVMEVLASGAAIPQCREFARPVLAGPVLALLSSKLLCPYVGCFVYMEISRSAK